MEIEIDCREIQLITFFQKLDLSIKALTIGDIIIKKDSKELVIIERKTLSDFLSSIKSSRYSEQRERLKLYRTENPHVKIIYMVEGTRFDLFPEKSIIFGAMENLILFHDIYVLFTINTEHTAKTIENMSKKLSETDTSSLKESLNLPVTKKAKINENMFLLQLCLIPGVSRTVAEKIVEKYENLQIFLETKPGIENLADILIAKRKLGKKLAEKIIQVYWGAALAV